VRADWGRVAVDGRHLRRNGAPYRVKGVTYGSFRARSDGALFPEPGRIEADLDAMARCGFSTVRTYTLPPVELLEGAAERGMTVLAGLHYDDWRSVSGSRRQVRRQVRDAGSQAVDEALARLGGRPEVLAVAVGNEVPTDLLRVHGVRSVQAVLGGFVRRLHEGDPELLVTYSNFPTTEYVRVPDLDLTCFNVFLEDPERLGAYLRHLHTVAGPTPLLITELGLGSELHGEQTQASSLHEQLCAVDESGCAGATVFSWTDEWGVADQAVEGWGFGLTRADRSPKPALEVASTWAASDLRDLRPTWPPLSVVVCAYNEAALLAECLDSLEALDYPGLDVVLCDDGSTDETLTIMHRYSFRVLDLPHGGLSAARNAGLAAARGEVVAYLDADAHCHPEWPYHLVLSMQAPRVTATGGPNLPVESAGLMERAVAAAPGGPVEVLTADDRAEHVPGCNMTFSSDALRGIGGFDVVFTSAGDDVDVCWKLLDTGGEIAFAPAAQVRHHRRSSVRGYLKQQRGYGRSERMVATRHPHRFNRLGQARWAGCIYGGLDVLPAVLRPVVYHGSLGSAPYQPVVARPAEAVLDWWAALLPLCAPVALAGLAVAPVAAGALALPAFGALSVGAYAAVIGASARPPRTEPNPLAWRLLVTGLHVAQPFARTWGRLRGPGLPGGAGATAPLAWTGDRLQWLTGLERDLRGRSLAVRYGTPSSRWDIAAAVGPFLQAQVSTAVTWSWTPSAAVRVRPRVAAVALAGATALLAAAGLPVVACAAAAGVLAVEGRVLRGRVHASVDASTGGARLQVEASQTGHLCVAAEACPFEEASQVTDAAR
jgi:hypothetical protein